MSFLKLFILLISFLILNQSCVCLEIESDRDFSEHIQAQIDAKNKNIKLAFNALAMGATPETHETLSGSIGVLSMIAPIFISAACPIGYFLEFIAGCLEYSKSLHEREEAVNFGYNVAKGVKGVVDESNQKYDVTLAINSLQSLIKLVTKYNKLTESKNSDELKYLANTIDFEFSKELSAMVNTNEDALSSVGIWTITANAHLLFLSHLVLNSDKYGFATNETLYFYTTFIDTKKEYENKIQDIDIWGQKQLQVGVQGRRFADEWNYKNQYYNFMKIFVYDISNYWYYLDPVIFPKGVAIENAHVTLSNIFGSAYDGTSQKSYTQINQLLERKQAYMYNGRFIGLSVRNNYCYNAPSGFEYYIPKYIKGRNYFIRKGIEMDTSSEGDGNKDVRTSRNGEIYFYKIEKPISSITAYSANGLDHAKLYQFGIDLNGTIKIGDTTWVKNIQNVSFPNKVVSTVIPLTYNDCKISCRDYNSQDKIKMIEGAIVGFVNKDIVDENIIIQGIATMVDAQKYSSINSNVPNIEINGYKSSIKFTKNTKVTYQLTLNSYEKAPLDFKILFDYKQKNNDPLNIKMYYSSSLSSNNPTQIPVSINIINSNFSNYGDTISNVAFIKLQSSKMNFITIENNGNDFLLNSLLFVNN